MLKSLSSTAPLLALLMSGFQCGNALAADSRFPTQSTAGMFTTSVNGDAGLALDNALASWPKLSEFLWYKSFEVAPEGAMRAYYDHEQTRNGSIALQIGFFPNFGMNSLSGMSELAQQLRNPGSESYARVQMWAEYLKDKGPVYLRMMSEMNLSDVRYELLHPEGPTPQVFANVWTAVRDIFTASGAMNVAFVYNPGGGNWGQADRDTHWNRGDELAYQALQLIPRGYIDGLGLNVYTRSYQGNPVSVDKLVSHWVRKFDQSIHAGLPMIIGEMSVSYYPMRFDQDSPDEGVDAFKERWRTSDAAKRWEQKRARWVCETFDYFRKTRDRFKMISFFNAYVPDSRNKDWSFDPESLSGHALAKELERGIGGPSYDAAGGCAVQYPVPDEPTPPSPARHSRRHPNRR